MSQIVIVSAKRTPIGSFLGQFKSVSATDLGAMAIEAALTQAGISGADLSEVIMGCVLTAGLGQAPARQASLKAGVPNTVGCTTINKVCGSALKAVMLGHDAIKAGSSDIVVAGGMESMSRAPYLLRKARAGMRMGHGRVLDHMYFDALQSPFDEKMMGVFGEMVANRYHFTREQQDAFAITSVQRAQRAMAEGDFADEIAPAAVKTRHSSAVYDQDEEPPRCNIEKIPQLRPAFKEGGSVTAANSSSISDGAAAMVLMTAEKAAELGIEPLVQFVAHATHAHEPEWFTTAPSQAIAKVLKKAGWKIADVDLFEINEAFAAVTMAAMTDLKLDHAKVNVNGGACALGHPLGATGARILVTLIHAMRHRGARRGIATLCLGGGEAVAVAVELPA